MLLRAHRSGIDVHVWIDFDGSDVHTGHFEQKTGGGRCKRLIRDEKRVSGLVRRAPMTPLPMPLTTPPETRMYFILRLKHAAIGNNKSRPRLGRGQIANYPPASIQS